MAKRRGKRWTASGYDKALGRKKHLGTYDSHREAVDAESDWRLRTRKTGSETCDGFAKRWTRDYPRPKASTNLHNAERVKRFARDFEGIKLGDVDRPAARTWVMKHRSNLAAVRVMFGDAVRDGLVEVNPFAELRLPGGRGRKDLVAPTEQELIAIADVALSDEMELGDFGPEYRAMILFSGYVGLRPGELFALRRDDVNGQMCTIERSLSSTGIGPTKTWKSRTVIVPPPAQDALLEVPAHPSGLLFTSPTDCMWTQPLHHRYWSLLRRFAKRPGFDFYGLRHSARELDSKREELAQHDAERRLEHGAALLGAPNIPRHVVFGSSTGTGLEDLAKAEAAALIVFGSDYRTPPGHAEPPNSAQQLLEIGAIGIAVAAAGLRANRDAKIQTIAALSAGGDETAQQTAEALAGKLGARVVAADGADADLIIVGPRPGEPRGRIELSGAVRTMLDASRGSVLVVPSGKPLRL